MLRNSQKTDIYTFASQHQQDPQPAGGSLFKADWFVMLDFEPNIIQTFITADTAETDKSYNDATVFSFWGIYEINTMGRLTGEYGIHWLDCAELRIEPKDLKDSFLDFWQDCSRHKIAPLLAAIEKKSTGVTLISTLQELRGIQIRNIERNRSSGSKTTRFLEIQQYVASKRISFTKGSRHAENCINHMSKITANDSHRHDDIADTLADAIKISLIDKSIRIDTKQNELLSASIMRPQLDRLQIETDLFYGGKY
jgi:predicted phage terminase large subunit-like protein